MKGSILSKKANGCSLLDSSVDWFTCTFTEGLRSRFAEAKSEQVMKEREAGGFERTFTNRLGFVGERAENFFYGKRADTLMVIGSGAVAASQAGFFLGLATHVSRLDLAVTFRDYEIDRDWTEIAYKQCSMDGRVDSGLLKTHRIQGTPDGRTLYIGSRSSDRYIRIYDKTAESKGAYPIRSWRWEIEYKKPRAGVVAARFLRHGAGPQQVLDIVVSAFNDLNIHLPIKTLASGWIARAPKPKTDDQTRLEYTHRVIAPFLERLIDRVGEEEVTKALHEPFTGDNYRPVKPRPRGSP